MPRCTQFLAKKGRLCGQSASPGLQLCGAHSPTHSARCTRCGTSLAPRSVKAHARVCPRARADAAVERAAWHETNCNRPTLGTLPAPADEPATGPGLETAFDDALRALAAVDEPVHSARALTTEEERERDAIAERWANPRNSWARGEPRHLAQACGLCALLLDGGHADAVAEFGAGRAYASLYVAETLAMRNKHASFFAVDRGANRNKADGALRAMAGRGEGVREFSRGRADIAHVRLASAPGGFLSAARPRVVGKHVCGAGTDAALRGVDNFCEEWRCGRQHGVMRVVVAACCTSTCEWEALHGIAAEWAAIGVGKAVFDMIANRASWGVNREEIGGGKAKVGAVCRLAVDKMRVRWLRRRGWHVRLVAYVGSHVTTENVCIVATWRIGVPAQMEKEEHTVRERGDIDAM